MEPKNHLQEQLIAANVTVHPSVQKYVSLLPLELPIKAQGFDAVVTSITGLCKECGATTEQLRGKVREHLHCLELEAGGLCKSCHLITYFKLRWYDDGRSIFQTDGGWKEGISERSQQGRLQIIISVVCEEIDRLFGFAKKSSRPFF